MSGARIQVYLSRQTMETALQCIAEQPPIQHLTNGDPSLEIAGGEPEHFDVVTEAQAEISQDSALSKLEAMAPLIWEIPGDREHFPYIYDIFYPIIFAYIYSRTRDREEARDFTHDVFFNAWRNIVNRGNNPIEAKNMRAWLNRIATNVLYDRGRRRKRLVIENGYTSDDDSRHPSAKPWAQSAHKEGENFEARFAERELIAGIIRGMPEKDRHILVLRDVENLTPTEIAELMGLPVNTIKGRLTRARKIFIAQYKREMNRQKAI